jgi:hypothetical protein
MTLVLAMMLTGCGGSSGGSSGKVSTVPAPSSPPATSVGQSSPPASPSPSTAAVDDETEGIQALAWNLVKSEPENGWVTYNAYFGIINQGVRPVIAAVSQPGQATARVETEEGHFYRVDAISNGPSVSARESNSTSIVLPPRTPIKGAPKLFSTTFRVPELLHPTTVRLNHWLAVGEQPQVLMIDLTTIRELEAVAVTPTNTSQQLPFTIHTGTIDLEVSPREMRIDNYGDRDWRDRLYKGSNYYVHWDWPGVSDYPKNGFPAYDARFFGEATVTFDYSAKNTNIAADANPRVAFRLVGEQHRQSPISSGRQNDSCGLPSSIGPGQTVTGTLCFKVPISDVIGDGMFQLLVWGETLSSYGVSFGSARLANCQAAPVETIVENAPGSKHRPIHTVSELSAIGTHDYQIITEAWSEAHGIGNKLGFIELWKVTLPDPRSLAFAASVPGEYILDAILTVMDPSGTLVSSAHPDGDNWAHVDRVCSTPYYVVLTFATSTGQAVAWGAPYPLTVLDGQQAEEQLGRSPEDATPIN